MGPLAPFVQTAMPTVAQSDPYLQAMQATQAIRAQQLQNQAAQTKSIFEAPSLQAQLQNQLLANQKSQAELPYAGPQAAANVQETQARIPLMNAQTGLTNMQTAQGQFKLNHPLFMLDSADAQTIGAIKLLRDSGNPSDSNEADRLENLLYLKQQSMLAGANYRNTMANLAAPRLQVAQGNLARQVANSPYGATVLSQPGQNGQPNPSAIAYGNVVKNSLNPSAPNVRGNIQAPLQQQISNAMPSTGAPMAPQQMAQPLDKNSANSLAQAIQNAGQSQFMKDTETARQRDMLLAANTAEQHLSQILPQFYKISQFATLAGKANKTIDEYKSAAGLPDDDPNYQAYLNFSTVQAPIVGNEIRKALGGQPTDYESKLLSSVTNPVTWQKTPAQAIAAFNTLVNMLRAQEGVLSSTPAQLQQNAQRQSQLPQLPTNGGQTITIRNKRTGEVKTVTPDEARRLGAMNG